LIAQSPEYLANGALHHGTRGRARSHLPADHYPEAGLRAGSIISAQYNKKIALSARRESASELRLPAEPCLARQPLARRLQTARRARPFARRALITARPPRVFMRSRKPWVRARRVFEG
jgi:hypothetical protein